MFAFRCARVGLRKTLRDELARYGAAVDYFGWNGFCHWCEWPSLGRANGERLSPSVRGRNTSREGVACRIRYSETGNP